MQSLEGLPEKEIQRRLKISKKMKKVTAKKRKAGLRAYWARRRKEKAEKEKAELAEKKRLKKEQDRANGIKQKRKKKPGPTPNYAKRYRAKKKKEKERQKRAEERENKEKREYNFKILICRNGKRSYTIGKYYTSEDAYLEFNRQKFISESVRFPKHIHLYDHTYKSTLDECVMIERTDRGPSMLRNEYGKIVEQKTDLEGWEIIDKFRFNIEETFWIWGYDSRNDRKTFDWIYKELLVQDGFGPYEFRRVFTYRNKLMVRYDDGSLEFVVCKGDYDSVRLYNELQVEAKKDKLKQLLFIGDKTEKTESTLKLEKELQEMTGWTIKKIRMNATKYFTLK